MAKFYGKVGYAHAVEVVAGVYEDSITEMPYFGDVIRNARRLQENGEQLHDDITVQNSISIVADAYAYENIFAMRYIIWMGTYWKVSDVEVVRPRLTLRLGGEYHGPKASTPDTP